MPYIPAERRDEDPETSGELNYALTRMAVAYLNRGERNRRVMVPYENEKCAANGDVY